MAEEDKGNYAEQKSTQNSISNSSTSDSNPCPICLAPLLQDSYLDRCFHKFCYSCIVHWTKVVASKHSQPPSSIKCPLCKTENFSIIHGYDGSSFQQHYINQEFGTSDFFSKAHKFRLQSYYTESGAITDKFNVAKYWKSRKYLQPNQWLHNWLRREIQSLIQEEDVELIVHHILGTIDSLRRNEPKGSKSTAEIKREEFKALVSQAARPFLTGRTDRFVDEVERFLASGLNIEAYDQVYMQHLGWKVPELIGEDKEGEPHENAPVLPYLYFFEDSDETD